MTASADKLAVATYNIHRCVGTDRNWNPQRIIGVINAMNADLVALQEVECGGYEDQQLDYIAHHTGYHATAGAILWQFNCHYGNALLTRKPPRRVHYHDISVKGCEPRGLIEAHLDIFSQSARVIAGHFGLRGFERRLQFEYVLGLLKRAPHLVTMVLLDSNQWWPFTPALARLRRRASACAGLTFPSFFPLLALDRIWLTGQLQAESVTAWARHGARRASDHLPLRAIVRWGGGTLQIKESG